MKDMTLLVMAAGMGSRYGGLKQLDAVGPNGETIIDFSVYDAIRAGYNKVVFIIRKDFEKQFKQKISNKYKNKIDVEIVYQDLNDLPRSFRCPNERSKPWGTGHAILAARNAVSEPFVAINGDDFYGKESFEIISNYYSTVNSGFAMVAFQLDKTLSENGSVSRGICEQNSNELVTVVETHDIKKNSAGIIECDRDISFLGSELVSMNMWGFTPTLFDHLEKMFNDFLTGNISDLKSEFLIPSVINDLIEKNIEKVKVLKTQSTWFGVTYVEDKAFVESQIKELIQSGEYPVSLF
ncbi:nucleotidyltransferase [bacterium]|nr:MAG: nucleotidyltransferase [bacterium]|tara:strand:- start:172 stop:1056 length:885 start_codon:yes stop_codon:yes gene_type:complete